MNVQVVFVDPQNDFCVADDGHGHKGTLVVGGAQDDMRRLAKMVDRVGPKIDEIHVTLDSHQMVGIERPAWWKNSKDGSRPAPFTVLGLDAKNRIVALKFENGQFVPTDVEYTTFRPSLYDRSRKYLKALADGKRYPHVVWTVHCVVGTWGWSIVPELAEALGRWEDKNFARVNYVVKGNNPYTEHFSGIKAEVPMPDDPTTQVNTGLVQTLETADIIGLGGEALSHCVANTGRDIAALFSDPKYVQKITLLTDASSSVGGYEFLGEGFVKELTAKGMKKSTTVEFLS
jgi:nicotinamidase/pyrazinamidase